MMDLHRSFPGTYLTSIGYTVRPNAQTKYPTTVVTDSKDLANSAPNFIANSLPRR